MWTFGDINIQTISMHVSLSKTVGDSNHVKLCGNYRSIRHSPCLKIFAIFLGKVHSCMKQESNQLRKTENLIVFYKLLRGRSTKAKISPFNVSEATEIFLPNGLTLLDLSWFRKIEGILIERTEREGHSGQGEIARGGEKRQKSAWCVTNTCLRLVWTNLG